MKRTVPFIIALLFSFCASAQITSPNIRANFGVDAELEANFYNGFSQAGVDDWFNNGRPGPGVGIIDTTGASYILNRYTTVPASRMQPFVRGMAFPQFSVVNNRILLDAMFIRDHHGDDSTVFAAGSNKNGMAPSLWSCPVSQGVPDKNDILDMMVHVRRAGPNVTDSMWMFGGLSLDGVTGNRYFDFEMYQTDIYYDQTLRKFFGYGPDAGHTRWIFDASGNVLQAGDIIFSAEYGNSSLSNIEARIWIDKADLSITPANFSWGGNFDGDGNGATYGYASIAPKAAGTFFTGLQSGNGTWTGPFKAVLQNNSVVSTYGSRQYMEFSVNLSKLGLDPLVTAGDPCSMPFRRILVKTRASTSFTAELKDFVGPFAFFRAPRAQAMADVPFFCGTLGVTDLTVTNALSTSLYTWTTPDGHIVGDSVGPGIRADQPGMYIVSQQLMDSCGWTYARDTVMITYDPNCTILPCPAVLNASKKSAAIDLNWTRCYADDQSYILERSYDGIQFVGIADVSSNFKGEYLYSDPVVSAQHRTIYYRLRVKRASQKVEYSAVVAVSLSAGQQQYGLHSYPNPVHNSLNADFVADQQGTAHVSIYSATGLLLSEKDYSVRAGKNSLKLEGWQKLPAGQLLLRITVNGNIYTEKLLHEKH